MPDCEKTVQVAYLYVIRCTILMCVCKGCIRVAVHSPMRWSEERGTPQMCSAAWLAARKTESDQTAPQSPHYRLWESNGSAADSFVPSARLS